MVTNLIPMAGKGQRFIKENYKISKPLIEISGEPMIINAIKTFPKADDWIFVCRKEHITIDKIDEKIKTLLPDSKFLSIDYITEGQACTCLLAKELINLDKPLFIGSCDSSITWNKKKYEELINEIDTDIICFGFTNQNKLSSNPQEFGWIKLKNDRKTIEKISVKTPISNDPYNDYALVSLFYFKTARLFFEIVENLIKVNDRINNEFYIDSCINQGIKLGYKAKIFVVNQYVGWGTPRELKEYEFWKKFFIKNKEEIP